jgi:Flp pilus assembly protein protease CpaA
MKYILLTILAVPFLYLNFKIIYTDLKEKKIPNKYLKYLLFLLPFFYVYTFSYFDVNILSFFIQTFFTFLICFVLYYFWVWSAWDAKYLLVLALFIPNIWIIPFIWNVALLTVVYLFLYFIWFYFWKCLFNWEYSKSLYKNIYIDLSEKWKIYKNNNWWNTFYLIFKWFLGFLIIFVSIRISRLYILNYFFDGWWGRNEAFMKIFTNYGIYVVLLVILAILWVFILIRKIVWYLQNKFKFLKIFALIILILFLIWFIAYEYNVDKLVLLQNLKLIFTYYIILWFMFRILKYSYKIVFQISEQYFVNIKDLKEWDIIDKDYLVKMFGKQACLWYCDEENEKEEIKNERERCLLYPNPGEYFLEINNPIDEDDVKMFRKIYNLVNKYHKKNTPNYEVSETIKILNTFAFWGYIFVWFLMTYFLEDKIFQFLIDIVVNTFYYM